MPSSKKSGYDLYETNVKSRDGGVSDQAKMRWDKLPAGSREIWNEKAAGTKKRK